MYDDQYTVDYSRYPPFSDAEFVKPGAGLPTRVNSFEEKYLLESQGKPTYYPISCGRGPGCYGGMSATGERMPCGKSTCFDCGRAKPQWWWHDAMKPRIEFGEPDWGRGGTNNYGKYFDQGRNPMKEDVKKEDVKKNEKMTISQALDSDMTVFGINIFIFIFMLIIIVFIGYAAKTLVGLNSYIKKMKKQHS